MLSAVTENGATYIWRPGQVSQRYVWEGLPLWACQARCQGTRRCTLHCSQVGPHLGTRVPMGTFFRFWVPIGSPFFFKVPIFSNSGLRTRENSVQPPSNVDHLIIQCKWHKHCALNEDTLCLCEHFLLKEKLASSMN